MTFDQWWKHIFGDKKIPDWIHETVVRNAYEAAAKAEYEFECPRCGHCCEQREWAMQEMVAENQRLGLYDEPVAWIKKDELAYMSAVAGQGMTEWRTNLGLVPEPGDVPLYTTCQQNRQVAKSATTEWVGLTDEERAECWSTSAVQSALNIEAKLKEKNNAA
jgi:hypothetical protein